MLGSHGGARNFKYAEDKQLHIECFLLATVKEYPLKTIGAYQLAIKKALGEEVTGTFLVYFTCCLCMRDSHHML